MTRLPLGSLRPWLAEQLRRGPRTVVLTPMSARVGNLLYFWLRANTERQEGRDVRVRESEHFADWPSVWPEVAALSVARLEIARTDRLLAVPTLHFQRYGTDFTRSQLEGFIHQCLLTSEFTAAMSEPDPSILTVNVRRGDYYSDPEFRERYGIDLEGYLRRAVDVASAPGGVRRVVVVSDDPGWCDDQLTWLREVGPVEISDGGPLRHLAILASATNLVLSNSTFSYWGGYLASAASETCRVVAPRFHVRDVNDGVPWQHDPNWTVIDAV